MEIYQQEEKVWEQKDHRTVFKPDPTDLAFYYNHSGDIRQTLFVELGQWSVTLTSCISWPIASCSNCFESLAPSPSAIGSSPYFCSVYEKPWSSQVRLSGLIKILGRGIRQWWTESERPGSDAVVWPWQVPLHLSSQSFSFLISKAEIT